MHGNPLSLVLVVTLALSTSTVLGTLSCAAWLISAGQLRVAAAVVAFALLVVPGELVSGAILGLRLQRRQPWRAVAGWLTLWVTGSAGAVAGSLWAGPAPEEVIGLGLALAVAGGLLSAWRQGAPRALLRTTVPWAVGAGPLWWAAGCAPATPGEAAVQGAAVFASVLLPVVVARTV